MHEKTSSAFEYDIPESLIARHGCLPWISDSGDPLDHHPVDSTLAAAHLGAESALYVWQYVDGAISANSTRQLVTFIGDRDALSSFDQGNLSTRRWFAEELGFFVSSYSVNFGSSTASAEVRGRRSGEYPSELSRAANLGRNDCGLDRDEIDRWHSSRYIASYAANRHADSLGDVFRQASNDLRTAGYIKVDVGPNEDIRGRLSFVRRALTLSGCEIGSFVRDKSRLQNSSFVADASVIDPALSLM